MNEGAPRLLPDDPEEIRRIYREILSGGVEGPGEGAQEMGCGTLAAALLDFGIGPGIAALVERALPEHAPVPTLLTLLGTILAAFLPLFVAAGVRLVFGKRLRGSPVFGPFTALLAWDAARGERRKAPPPAFEVDATSLEVLEPVARHLAAPVLRRAEAFVASPLDGGEGAILAELRERLRRVERHLAEEPDPAWREAAEAHRARLEARVRDLQREIGRGAELRARVYAESEALRAHLALLSRRRELARAMAQERDLPAAGAAPIAAEAETLRANLAALTASLGEGDALARARLGAEREMDALERG